MKKYLLVSLFFSLTQWAIGQKMVVQTQSEYTVAGIQHGASLLYESGASWGAGVFYQAGLKGRAVEDGGDDAFLGVILQAPFTKTERISFFANLRAGFVNEKFLAIVPGLETRVHLTPRFGTSFGMSLRMGYPAVSGKLFLKMF